MMIQDTIGEKVNHFSYPYGQKNHYNKHTIDILKKCSFLSSVTTNLGCYVAKASQYEIPRLTVRDWNIENFIQESNGIAGKMVSDGFCYNSGSNKIFLTIKELQELISSDLHE